MDCDFPWVDQSISTVGHTGDRSGRSVAATVEKVWYQLPERRKLGIHRKTKAHAHIRSETALSAMSNYVVNDWTNFT